jgi:hypothetical protein
MKLNMKTLRGGAPIKPVRHERSLDFGLVTGQPHTNLLAFVLQAADSW